jgi:hypothetical protein
MQGTYLDLAPAVFLVFLLEGVDGIKLTSLATPAWFYI